MISTQFLQKCQSGDEEAIQTLVRTHQRGVFQLALSILDDSPATAPRTSDDTVREAELATRETFVTALNRIGRYREDMPFAAWIYRIAILVSQRRSRRWKLRRFFTRGLGRLLPMWFGPGETAASTLEANPHLLPGDAEMWLAVRELDSHLRLPVVLRYYHDFPIDEIARLLHMSEGAVHARLDAARERIAKDISK